jgi:hypothetical protein
MSISSASGTAKAVEHWGIRDDMALMRQLGVLPGRPAPVAAAG